MHAQARIPEFLQYPRCMGWSLEVLIPALANCEVQFVIIFLNAQRIAPIEIHRQLCQVYDHTRLYSQQISCRIPTRCLIISHPIARISRPVISIFSYTSWNSCPVSVSVFRMTESRRWESQWLQFRAADSTTQNTKVGPTVWQMSQSRRWIRWKIARYLLIYSN